MAFLAYLVWRTAKLSVLSLLAALALPIALLVRRGPQLARWYMETSGAGYIKLGQILATRYDLLPPRYLDELAKLLDRTQPAPFRRIRRVLAAELGADYAERVTIEPVPIASASIAQVHGAVLADGRRVVVKIMRPRVELAFRVDIFYLRAFARILDFLDVLGITDLRGLIDELARLTEQELDFRREARHAELLRERFAGDAVRHHAPAVIFELCTTHVLTQERLDGVWVHDLLRDVRRGDRATLDALAARGITPDGIAALLFRSVLEQVFRHHVFHADPHPANLVIRDDGSLGYVDFGMVGWLDERLAAQNSRVFELMGAEQVHAAYEALLETLEPLPARDLGEFEGQIKDLVQQWIVAAHNPHSQVREKCASQLLIRMAEAMRRAGLRLPWQIARAHRALIISDSVIFALWPRTDPVAQTALFYADERKRRTREALRPEAIGAAALAFGRGILDAATVATAMSVWMRERLGGLERDYRYGLDRFGRALSGIATLFQLALLATAVAVLVSPNLSDWAPAWFVGLRWYIVTALAVLAFLVRRVKRSAVGP